MNKNYDPVEAGELSRVLDASFNRAAEGLRVIEDVLRLVCNDAVLALKAKLMRHAVGDILSDLDLHRLVASRNVVGDVGRTLQTDQEYSRESAGDLIIANVKRVQQSLRTIEECLKSHSRKLATSAEALRYESYQLEQAIAVGAAAHEALAQARLYVLLDGRASRDAFTALAGELIDAGADLIQLRAKTLDDCELLARGEILARLTRDSQTRWIMNDRADLAAISGAAGVHLGQEDLPVALARRFVSPGQWIGISAHSFEQAERAISDGATYIGVGPVFASRTKQFQRLAGVELIEQVAQQVALPFFVIGGINLENVDQVLKAGATRIAVGGAIVDAASPATAIRDFREKLAVVFDKAER